MKNPRMGSVIRAVTQFCLHYHFLQFELSKFFYKLPILAIL